MVLTEPSARGITWFSPTDAILASVEVRKSLFVRPEATEAVSKRPQGGARERGARERFASLFFFGTLLGLAGLALYSAGILLALLRATLGFGDGVRSWNEAIIGSAVSCAVWERFSSHSTSCSCCRPSGNSPRRKVFETAFGSNGGRRARRHTTMSKASREAVTDFRSHPLGPHCAGRRQQQPRSDVRGAARAGARGRSPKRSRVTGECVYRCFQEALARPKDGS